MDSALSELVWNLLGRGPVVAALVFLTWWAGRRSGTLPALLGLSGFCGGAIVGTSLVPSIIGAMGGGVLGALLSWRALGAGRVSPAPVAVVLLAVIALGRVGCFLTGCCFGRPFESPLAVRYPVGLLVHGLHVGLGLVGDTEPPLGVFPVQAVESAGVLLLLALAALARRRVRHDGAWALGLLAGYLALRAALDPWRAMVNTAASAHWLGPLSHFQWGALLAAAAAAGSAAWLARRGEVAEPAQVSVPLRFGAAVWLAQAGAALAFQSEGTWMLRALAVGSLAASAGGLLWAAAGARAVRWGLLAAGLALLTPLVPRAADGGRPTPGWLYAIVRPTGQLVRLGPGTLPQRERLARYAELLEQPVSDPPLVAMEPQPLLDGGLAEGVGPVVDGGTGATSGEPPAPLEARPSERSSVSVQLAGGVQGYSVTTCGSTVSGIQRFGAVSAEYNGVHRSNRFQLRARLLVNDAPGAAVTATGLYEWKWRLLSLGLGLEAGVSALGAWGSSGPFRPLGFLPLFGPPGSPQPVLTPILYLRIAVVELGTGSRFQPQAGPFLGVRINDEDEAFGFRFGVEFVWLPYPVASAGVYAGGWGRLSDTSLFEVRGTLGAGNSGPGALPSFTFGLRYTYRLE